MSKRILEETKKARAFTITMDPGIMDRIDREASSFHLSRSSWLKLAALNEIRRRQKEQGEVLLQGSGTATNHGTLTTSTTTVDGDGLQHNDDSS
jgi:predicted transcriptional regulator